MQARNDTSRFLNPESLKFTRISVACQLSDNFFAGVALVNAASMGYIIPIYNEEICKKVEMRCATLSEYGGGPRLLPEVALAGSGRGAGGGRRRVKGERMENW